MIKWIVILMMLPVCGWGQSIKFDGTDAYAQGDDFGYYTNLTVCMLITPDSSDITRTVSYYVTKRPAGSGANEWGLYLASGKVSWFIYDTAQNGVRPDNTSEAQFTAGINYWVIGRIINGKTNDLYVNGKKYGTTTSLASDVFNSATPLVIGSDASRTISRFPSGVLHCVIIYPRALTVAEIELLSFAYPLGSTVPSGAVLHYKGARIQSGATIPDGIVVSDITGNGHNAGATNGPISAPSIIGNRRTK